MRFFPALASAAISNKAIALRSTSLLEVWPLDASCSKRSFNSGETTKVKRTESFAAVVGVHPLDAWNVRDYYALRPRKLQSVTALATFRSTTRAG